MTALPELLRRRRNSRVFRWTRLEVSWARLYHIALPRRQVEGFVVPDRDRVPSGAAPDAGVAGWALECGKYLYYDAKATPPGSLEFLSGIK